MFTYEPHLSEKQFASVYSDPDNLPQDLELLTSFLRILGQLIEEKSVESHSDFQTAEQSAAEIETLFEIEERVAGTAADIRASSLNDVMSKLNIWDKLSPSGETTGECVRDRLVASIKDDIEHIRGKSAVPMPLRCVV